MEVEPKVSLTRTQICPGYAGFWWSFKDKSLTLNQNIYLNTGARMNISNSILTGISAMQGSSVDLNHTTFNCLPDKVVFMLQVHISKQII